MKGGERGEGQEAMHVSRGGNPANVNGERNDSSDDDGGTSANDYAAVATNGNDSSDDATVATTASDYAAVATNGNDFAAVALTRKKRQTVAVARTCASSPSRNADELGRGRAPRAQARGADPTRQEYARIRELSAPRAAVRYFERQTHAAGSDAAPATHRRRTCTRKCPSASGRASSRPGGAHCTSLTTRSKPRRPSPREG